MTCPCIQMREAAAKVSCFHCRKGVAFKDGQHFVNDGLQPKGIEGRMVTCGATKIRSLPLCGRCAEAEGANGSEVSKELLKYATHKLSCEWRKPDLSNFKKRVCNCGLDDLRRRV